MKAFLVHGMGRTPASQFLLAKRLRAGGLTVRFFGYTTLQPLERVVDRFRDRVESGCGHEPFVLVGHSLGCVIMRQTLPRLSPLSPAMCFFLAPPGTACRAARALAQTRAYKVITRDMGRHLAHESFMSSLPVPEMPVRIYAGTAGPTGRFSPFGDEENDAVLAVSETAMAGPDVTLMRVPALHTFIMNSRFVASDIAASALSARR